MEEPFNRQELIESRRLAARANVLGQMAGAEIQRSRALLSGYEERFRRSREHLRHLPGEDLETPLVEDARHWVRVYGELLRGLELLAHEAEGQPAGRRVEVWRVRLQRRLRYWESRTLALNQEPGAAEEPRRG